MNNIITFFKESKPACFFIPFGIILIAFSIFLFIDDKHKNDFIETEGTISKVILVKEETIDANGNIEPAEYDVFVKYTIKGVEYETELGQMLEMQVGDKMNIVYDPRDPNNISQPGNPILNLAILIGGITALVVGIISGINALKRSKALKETESIIEPNQ